MFPVIFFTSPTQPKHLKSAQPQFKVTSLLGKSVLQTWDNFLENKSAKAIELFYYLLSTKEDISNYKLHPEKHGLP